MMLKRLSLSGKHIVIGLYFAAWIAYFGRFWSRALFIDQFGALVAGHVNMWGDWAAHFTMGSALAYRNLPLISSPFLYGAEFAYPYAANLLAALLVRSGVPFFTSFLTLSFVFSCLIVVALYYFYRVVFKSWVIAILASLIFLLNGGMGFWYFIQDIRHSPAPIETALNPPHEYTRLDKENIKWISVIDSMIIPQRAFTHGFPIALLALGWLYSIAHHKNQSITNVIAPSVLLGILPFIHTHSFLAASIILAGWSGGQVVLAWKQGNQSKVFGAAKKWAVVAAITGVIAVPIVTMLVGGQAEGFMQWFPGWLATEFKMNWFVFWWKNWGLTPWLAAAGLVWHYRQAKTFDQRSTVLYTFAPFFVLFALANLVLFQPFSWDNTKIIAWASVGFSGLVAYLLVETWQWRIKALALAPVMIRPLVIIAFVVTIASGAIDAYWIQRRDLHSYAMYSAEELELANWVKTNTAHDSLWLTGDQHNHFLFNLTGRQSLLTYRGWLWTHGYDYLPTERDVSLMLQFPDRTDLFTKYGVDYAVIGPNERQVWGANTVVFDQQFDVVKETTHYQIYRTSF